METRGFSRAITIKGVAYDLPHAEYRYASSSETANDVLTKAKAAAKQTQCAARIIITTGGMLVSNLARAELVNDADD